MAEVVTTALLRLVFDKLSSKALKELGLLMGLDKELEKMETTLSTINDVLEDAEARQVKEKALRGWLKKLKDIAFEVDDVLDEVATKSMKRKLVLFHSSASFKRLSNTQIAGLLSFCRDYNSPLISKSLIIELVLFHSSASFKRLCNTQTAGLPSFCRDYNSPLTSKSFIIEVNAVSFCTSNKILTNLNM